MMTLVNGNWGLTQQVYQLINDKNVDGNEQLTPEQLFSFTHDTATNLPSDQQAIMRFEQLIKQNSNQSFAVVVIKPRNFEHVNRVLGHQNSDILLWYIIVFIVVDHGQSQDRFADAKISH